MPRKRFGRQFQQHQFCWHSNSDRPLFRSSVVVDGSEHVSGRCPDLVATLREDNGANEDVGRDFECRSQPTETACAGDLRSLGSNRFFSLATDSEDDEVERRTLIDADSCSDTVSLIGRGNSRRRLRLRWSEDVPTVAHTSGCGEVADAPDSHDMRLRRVREVLQREIRPAEGLAVVRAAATLIQNLAHRVGAVPAGAILPVAIRKQPLSPLIVPLLWGVAGVELSEPVFEWLTSIASAIQERVEFHGSHTSASEALRMGWALWRAAMRSWGINCTEQLTTWLRSHGFPATRPGHHISASAQEFIIHEVCTTDARAALLEAVFVLITLHQGRASGVQFVTRASYVATRRTVLSFVPLGVLEGCWEQLDEVVLAEWFLKRVPMLKTCPHFCRGRLWQCFTVVFQEWYRARQVGDLQADERAWKVCGLVPMMLMHRPGGSASTRRKWICRPG